VLPALGEEVDSGSVTCTRKNRGPTLNASL
jgi:hypothetical protein